MNRLRGSRVLVELAPEEQKPEEKDAFKQTESGIFMAKQETEKKITTVKLRQATILRVGHEIHPQDLKEGMTVYVKPFQGERISPDEEHFLFDERNVLGND
jgi:co-chaperonin GroES (HSP10)